MGNSLNPILPAGYDIVWTTVSFLFIALVVVALVSLARAAKRLTSTQALLWAIVTIFVPLTWLLIGRRSGLTPVEPVAALMD